MAQVLATETRRRQLLRFAPFEWPASQTGELRNRRLDLKLPAAAPVHMKWLRAAAAAPLPGGGAPERRQLSLSLSPPFGRFRVAPLRRSTSSICAAANLDDSATGAASCWRRTNSLHLRPLCAPLRAGPSALAGQRRTICRATNNKATRQRNESITKRRAPIARLVVVGRFGEFGAAVA